MQKNATFRVCNCERPNIISINATGIPVIGAKNSIHNISIRTPTGVISLPLQIYYQSTVPRSMIRIEEAYATLSV